MAKLLMLLFATSSTALSIFINYQISGEITKIRATGITSVSVKDTWSVDLTVLSNSIDLLADPRGLYHIDWNGVLHLGSLALPICPFTG